MPFVAESMTEYEMGVMHLERHDSSKSQVSRASIRARPSLRRMSP